MTDANKRPTFKLKRIYVSSLLSVVNYVLSEVYFFLLPPLTLLALAAHPTLT